MNLLWGSSLFSLSSFKNEVIVTLGIKKLSKFGFNIASRRGIVTQLAAEWLLAVMNKRLCIPVTGCEHLLLAEPDLDSGGYVEEFNQFRTQRIWVS